MAGMTKSQSRACRHAEVASAVVVSDDTHAFPGGARSSPIKRARPAGGPEGPGGRAVGCRWWRPCRGMRNRTVRARIGTVYKPSVVRTYEEQLRCSMIRGDNACPSDAAREPARQQSWE